MYLYILICTHPEHGLYGDAFTDEFTAKDCAKDYDNAGWNTKVLRQFVYGVAES